MCYLYLKGRTFPFKIHFLSYICHISRVQQVGEASGYHIGKCIYTTFPSLPEVLPNQCCSILGVSKPVKGHIVNILGFMSHIRLHILIFQTMMYKGKNYSQLVSHTKQFSGYSLPTPALGKPRF